GDDLAVQRRKHQAPFRRRNRMRQTAAERAAVADWIMRDVVHHVGQKLSQRSFANRPMERGVANARADDERAAGERNAVERLDGVDIDEVRGFGQPERHGRNEALAAGEDAAVVTGKFSEQRDRFVDRFRRVIAECSGLHRDNACTFGGGESKTIDNGRRRAEEPQRRRDMIRSPSSVIPYSECLSASTISATGSKRFVSAPASPPKRSPPSSAFRAPRSIASKRASSPRSRRWRSSPSFYRSRCRRCSVLASNTSPRR